MATGAAAIALRVVIGAWLLLSSSHALATPDLTSFKDVQWETYVHHGPDFTLQYPYGWEMGKTERPGEVFAASGRARVPGLRVAVLDRPAGLNLTDSALAAARQLSAGFTVESQRNVDLGGATARVVVGRWTIPLGAGVPLRSMLVSVFSSERWVLLVATDGATSDGLLPALERAALSLRFPRGLTAPTPPAATRR